jgi:hypothetical protein
VAGGKVFVRGEYTLDVYGLLPPTLTVWLSAGTAVLSWTTNTSTPYNLEGTTELLSGSWSSITNPVVMTNGVFQVTLPLTGTAGFYRLRR